MGAIWRGLTLKGWKSWQHGCDLAWLTPEGVRKLAAWVRFSCSEQMEAEACSVMQQLGDFGMQHASAIGLHVVCHRYWQSLSTIS